MTEAIELWRAWSSNASANGRCLNCRVRKSAPNFSGILSAAFHRGIVDSPKDAYLLLKQRGRRRIATSAAASRSWTAHLSRSGGADPGERRLRRLLLLHPGRLACWHGEENGQYPLYPV